MSITVKDLTKVYHIKNGEDVRALDGVSFELPERGLVFFLGKSGSGKSTMLNVLGGLDAPDSGEMIIGGKSSKDFSPADYDGYRNTCVGFVFQEYNLLNEFTVGQNIALALQLQGTKNDNEAIETALKKVGLEGYAARKPQTLSGGQKQRVAIARALVKEPQIILADEPTGALDSATGKEILEQLKALSSEKLVVVVSHDREFAETYADRVIELKDGKIIADTTKDNSVADINEKTNALEFKKSRLPISKATVMGISGLKHKGFRLAVTIFLAAFAFMLFGLMSTAMFYNENNAIADAHVKSGSQFALLQKRLITHSTDLDTGEVTHDYADGASAVFYRAPIGERDISSFGGMSLGVYPNEHSGTDSAITNTSWDSLPALKYLSVLPEDHTLRDNFVAGEYPKSASEIAVSSYFYYCAKNGVYFPLDEEGNRGTPTYITAPEQLIDTRLNINLGDGSKIILTISGVFDSGEIPHRYTEEAMKDFSEQERIDEESRFYTDYLFQSLCLVGLVNKDFYFANRDLLKTDYYRHYMNYFDYSSSEYMLFDKNSGKANISGNNLRVYEKDPEYRQLPVTFFNGYEATETLNGYQFIVSSNYLQYYADNMKEQGEITQEEYDELKQATDSLIPYSILACDMPSEETREAAHNTIRNFFEKHSISVSVAKKNLSGAAQNTINLGDGEIIGFYDECDDLFTDNSGGIYCSQIFCDMMKLSRRYNIESNYAKDIDPEANFPYVLANFNSAAQMREIANKAKVNFDTDVMYYVDSEMALNARSVGYDLNLVRLIMMIAGIVSAILTVLMLFYFISVSITDKQKEIGILRAIGARSTDVFKIFFAESGVIVVICTLIALIGTFVFTAVINIIIRTFYSIQATLLFVGAPSILIMLGIALFTWFAATFIPVRRAAKKKPVDSIRSL